MRALSLPRMVPLQGVYLCVWGGRQGVTWEPRGTAGEHPGRGLKPGLAACLVLHGPACSGLTTFRRQRSPATHLSGVLSFKERCLSFSKIVNLSSAGKNNIVRKFHSLN